MRATITKLLELQGQLDQTVIDNLPDDRQSSDLRTERAIAMVCEFLEGVEDSLEEQADFLHFILSYALEWGLTTDDLCVGPVLDPTLTIVPRTPQEIRRSTSLRLAELLNLHERDWKFWKRRSRIATHQAVAHICSDLLRDIFELNYKRDLVGAYVIKNAENFRRQTTGY